MQAQALACGIPVLCSEFTGGRDIKALNQHPRDIVEVDIANQKSVLEGVDRIIQISKDYAGFDLLGDVGRTNLSWKGYGERYDTYLNAMVQKTYTDASLAQFRCLDKGTVDEIIVRFVSLFALIVTNFCRAPIIGELVEQGYYVLSKDMWLPKFSTYFIL